MADPRPFELRRHLPSTAFVLLLLLALAGFAGVFVYSGVYNIGADAPHSRAVDGLLRDLRKRSIAHHSRNIAVPKDLNDPRRIAAGAGLYQEMCTGCHLGPGIEPSEMSQGLYPSAPDLARSDLSPAEQFWTIKHGVKLTAMPAWGKTHNDALIWDMVAFIQQLPKLSPEQYKTIVASAPEDHDEMMDAMRGGQEHDTASRPHSPGAEPAAAAHHWHQSEVRRSVWLNSKTCRKCR